MLLRGSHAVSEIFFENIETPSDGDLRALLLNEGMKRANEQYIGFLDDDDLVYQHAYETLIDAARSAEAAISFGRCVRVFGMVRDQGVFAVRKDRPYTGDSIVDLIVDNFCPIHSYILDRNMIDVSDLNFDLISPYLEDYRFLLRLISKYRTTFVSMETDICEYWFYEGGINTTSCAMDRFSRYANEWRKAYAATQALKASLRFDVSMIDVELWFRTSRSVRCARHPDHASDAVLASAWEVESGLRLSHDYLHRHGKER